MKELIDNWKLIVLGLLAFGQAYYIWRTYPKVISTIERHSEELAEVKTKVREKDKDIKDLIIKIDEFMNRVPEMIITGIKTYESDKLSKENERLKDKLENLLSNGKK